MPIIAIIGIFILTLLLNAAITPVPPLEKCVSPSIVKKASVPELYEGRQHVFVLDQKATNQIAVLSFSISSPGFLVIQDKNTGLVLGTSHLLLPGLYSNGAIALTEPIVPGQELMATVYLDNGDGVFAVPPSSEKTKEALGDTPEPATSSFVILGEEKQEPQVL